MDIISEPMVVTQTHSFCHSPVKFKKPLHPPPTLGKDNHHLFVGGLIVIA